MRKTVSVVLFVLLLFSGFTAAFHAEGISTSAEAAILYCPQNGEVIYEKNPDQKLSMASTTKIMTTLLTLEEAEKENRVITFSQEMTAEGSSMYLKVGEKVTLRDLAVGMMMQSGNDAANAAAISLSGSMEKFADLMNARANAVGMQNTHFVTPSGLDDEDHYSTAHDMSLLMAEAMKNDSFRDITKNRSMTVSFTAPADKKATYPNHNRLLSLYENCIGGKTGYTEKSGRCLVTAAEKNGVELIAVTLNAPDDWDDHIRMYEYGFSALRALDTDDSGFKPCVDVVGAAVNSVELYAAPSEKTVVSSGSAEEPERTVFLPDFVYAPVKKGEPLGKVVYTLNGSVIAEHPLFAKSDVPASAVKKSLFEKIKDLLHWHS